MAKETSMAARSNQLRDIVVELTGSDEDKTRLAAAEHLCGIFDAYLIGARLHPSPPTAELMSPVQMVTIRRLLDDAEREADKSDLRLKHWLDAWGGAGEAR